MASQSHRTVVFVTAAACAALVTILGCPVQVGPISLAARVKALEAALATTQEDLASTQEDLMSAQADLATALAKLAYVHVQTGRVNGLKGPHLIIEGCNVHVRSGSGDTEDSAGLTGRGNVIVGYNELLYAEKDDRLGSHNLVVGQGHAYLSYGGFVAGESNNVSGPASTVSGGRSNDASGECSTVSGGDFNWASNSFSSVSGGQSNRAHGQYSSVSGGTGNQATKTWASISGGCYNTASGFYSSISGGKERSCSGTYNWAAGGLFESY